MLLGALITAVADPLRPEVLPDPLLGIFTVTLTGGALPCGMLSRVQSTVLASREQVQPSPLGSSITSAPGGSWIVMTGFDTGSGPALDASATITTGSLGFGPVGLRLTLIDRSEPLGVRFPVELWDSPKVELSEELLLSSRCWLRYVDGDPDIHFIAINSSHPKIKATAVELTGIVNLGMFVATVIV